MIISIHLIYSRNKYEFENLFKDAILENRESFAPNIKPSNWPIQKKGKPRPIELERPIGYYQVYISSFYNSAGLATW